MVINYLTFVCFWISILFFLGLAVGILRLISNDTERVRRFLECQPTSEHQKCFTCKQPSNLLYAETYQGLKIGLCCSCHGHYCNETKNNKLSNDKAIELLLKIYKEMRG